MRPHGNCNNTSSLGKDHGPSLIVTSIFTLFGLPGNVLVIILILRAKQRKSTTTSLLLSLAIADIVNLVSALMISILFYLIDDNDKAKSLLLLTLPGKIVANVTLAMIALERYNALVKTMKPSMKITRKKVISIITIVWCSAFTLCLPIMFFRLEEKEICKPPGLYFKALFIPILILAHVAPLIVVVFCYSSILKGLYVNRTILAEITDEATLRDKKRLVRGLVAITLVFLACNLPTLTIIMVKQFRFSKNKNIMHNLQKTALILGCLSSTLNPYLYALHSENYRSQVKQLICRKKNAQVSPDVCDSNL